MLKYITTHDIKYKGQLYKGRRILGTEEMLAKIYPLRKKAIFTSGWRSKAEQAEMVKKGVSKTMDSNHRRGVAFDIWNWKEMEAEMKKIGFINDISWDKFHFTPGGEAKARSKYQIIDSLPDKLKEYKPKTTKTEAKSEPVAVKKNEVVSTPQEAPKTPPASISAPTREDSPILEPAETLPSIETNNLTNMPMETPAQKTVKRASWQSLAIALSTIGGLLASQEVRDLVALYPKTLAILAVSSVVIMNITKAINSYLQFKEELEKF